jgi:ABC-type transport system substrate-binding protein
MIFKNQADSAKNSFKNFGEKFQDVVKIIKMVDLTILKRPKLINMAFKKATTFTRALLLIEVAIILVSFVTLGMGFYNLITIEIASSESETNESVVLNFKHLNPVFTPDNSLEDKITKMLYSPLYTVEYPQFGKGDTANFQLVLLKNIPTPSIDNKSFKFTLRDDINWSNGDKIDSADVKFTFDLIKNLKDSNSKFRLNFTNLDLAVVSPTEFTVTSSIPRSTLLYDFAFSPISKKLMESVPVANLFEADQTSKPSITSGNWKISEKQITDKHYTAGKPQPNPVAGSTGWNYMKLESTNKKVLTKFWNFKKYDSITTKKIPSIQAINMATELKNNGKIDLFMRSTNEQGSSYESSKDIADALKKKQDFVDSNWYLSSYFNQNPTDSRKKPAMSLAIRKYVTCSFYNLNMSGIDTISPLEPSERNLPISLNTTLPQDCDSPTLPDTEFKKNETYYSFVGADSELHFEILYFGYDQDPILDKIKANFDSGLGIKANVTTRTNNEEYYKTLFADPKELDKYDLVVMPREVYSFDLSNELSYNNTNVLGSKKIKNLDETNALIAKYNETTYGANEREVLAKHLNKEKISFYLGRYKNEINHNLIGKKESLFDTPNGILDPKYKIWYTTIARDWWFNKQTQN